MLTCQLAALDFSRSFYSVLDNDRKSILNFYVESSTTPDGTRRPTIVWNGNDIPTAEEFASMYRERMPLTKHTVGCVDCQIINNRYHPDLRSGGSNVSISVVISGNVRLVDEWGPLHEFNERFILVPNRQAISRRHGPPGQHKRTWMIAFQNVRYRTVHEEMSTDEMNGIQMDVDDMA